MLFFLKKSIKQKVNTGNENFNIYKFLTNTFICSALHTSLISCVLIPYFTFSGMLPLQISIIVTIKRLVRFIGDTFFGFIFDRFGAKIVFITGRLMKLSTYFILLFNNSFIVLCISMCIYGLSEGTIQGKVSSFMYNNLRANNKLSSFSKAMSMYYLVIDIHIALMSFLAGIVLKQYGYNVVLYISILTNIFSLYLLIKLIPSKSQNNLNQFVAKSFKDIVLTTKMVFQKNHLFAYLIALYGVLVFFAWQFGSVASMILLDMGMDGTGVAMMGSTVKICMAIGTLIPIFIIKNTISLKRISVFLTILILFGTITSLSYNLYLFCIFMILVDICYVSLEVSLEKNLETLSDKTIRGTAISLAMTFCSVVAVISNLSVGFLAQYFNFKIAMMSIFAIMLLLSLFLTYKVILLTKKSRKYE